MNELTMDDALSVDEDATTHSQKHEVVRHHLDTQLLFEFAYAARQRRLTSNQVPTRREIEQIRERWRSGAAQLQQHGRFLLTGPDNKAVEHLVPIAIPVNGRARLDADVATKLIEHIDDLLAVFHFPVGLVSGTGDGDGRRGLRPPAQVRLASGANLVEPADRRVVGGGAHHLGIAGDLLRDLVEGLDEPV